MLGGVEERSKAGPRVESSPAQPIDRTGPQTSVSRLTIADQRMAARAACSGAPSKSIEHLMSFGFRQSR
jgi:hypothetical protein